MLTKKSKPKRFLRMNRCVTDELIQTKFCASPPWVDVMIYLKWYTNWFRVRNGLDADCSIG